MKKAREEHPLVLGHKIRGRRKQQLIWIGMSVLLGSGFIAGLYWLVLQQDYHNLISALPPHTSLKAWWDGGMGFIRSGRWPVERHSIRDLGEPAAWTMIGATILGKAKTTRLLPLSSLVIAPVILLALLVAGAFGIAWVINFGFLAKVPDQLSWQQILLGMALGRVLHYLWNPIGATVRYHIVAHSAHGTAIPLWVRYPLMPPAWREMWAELRATARPGTTPAREESHGLRVIVPVAVFLFLLVAIVGNLAKYGVAHGTHIPVMNP
jgi:hypothetical protein